MMRTAGICLGLFLGLAQACQGGSGVAAMPVKLDIPGLGPGPAPALYPAGWSRDGKLAQVLAEAWNDASNTQQVTLGIYDLVTDGYRWSKSATIEGDESPALAKQAWQQHRKAFQSQLKRYRVVPCSFSLRQFPCKIRDDSISVQAEVGRIDAAGTDWAIPFVSRVEIGLASSKQGTKLVYQLAQRDSGYLGLIDVAVLGFLASPFERRIALLVATTYMGWEGPPNIHRLDIVGCHLEKGFQKKR